MSGRAQFRQPQGPQSHSTFNQYEALQDHIRNTTSVDCSVLVTPEMVSIRAASYADYLLAKNAIKGMVSQPIIQG